MKVINYLLLPVTALSMTACRNQDNNHQVVSQRYIHKYGYAVSKEDWEAKNYPGQVITHLASGETITATFENGLLHGPYTETYPNSQTLAIYRLYQVGVPVKELLYDVGGMPVQEKQYLSETRYTLTHWYQDGTPLSIEEYAQEELLEGQYFSKDNEEEARVEKGNGQRIRRDQKGVLLSKDIVEGGLMVKRETFYENGSPEGITHYFKGKLHGEKKTFSKEGEPLAVEEWIGGALHGMATYYKNGVRYLEVSYLNGQKNGMETHYIDGSIVQQEIPWENDKKHGCAIFYTDGTSHCTWYYAGKEVSESSFKDNAKRDEMTLHVSSSVKR